MGVCTYIDAARRGPRGLKEEAAMQELTEDTRFAVSVDGAEVQVDAGLTILSALKIEGIDIPSLCNDVRLERAGGNCGLCVVEVGEERREVKSCITPVTAGHGDPHPVGHDRGLPQGARRAVALRPQRRLRAALPADLPRPHRHPALPGPGHRRQLRGRRPGDQGPQPVPFRVWPGLPAHLRGAVPAQPRRRTRGHQQREALRRRLGPGAGAAMASRPSANRTGKSIAIVGAGRPA